MSEKEILRRKFKRELSLKKSYIAEHSGDILKKVKDVILDHRDCKKILLYFPLPIEPQIRDFYKWCWEYEFSTYLPVHVNDKWSICEFGSNSTFVINQLGISQPENPGELFESPADAGFTGKDILIIPALAFSKDRYRLGHGGGFYDRIKSDSLRIGVCIEDQLIENFPKEDHDVPMDMIITESRILG